MSLGPCFLLLLKRFFPQEEQGTRKRVAFRSNDGARQSDDGTPLTGRVTIAENLTLTITSVKPSDELPYICQVTAGPAGVGDGTTMLKVFCKSDLTLLYDLNTTFSKCLPPHTSFFIFGIYDLICCCHCH